MSPPQADYVLLLGTLESQQRPSCVKGSQSVQILSREKSHAQQWFCPQFLLPQSECCLTGICLWFLILQGRRVMSVRTTPAIPDVRGGGDNNRVLSPLLLLIQPCEGDGTTPTISDRSPSCCSSSKTVREVTSDRAHPTFLILQSKGGLHSPVSPLTSEVGRQWWNSHPPCS